MEVGLVEFGSSMTAMVGSNWRGVITTGWSMACGGCNSGGGIGESFGNGRFGRWWGW